MTPSPLHAGMLTRLILHRQPQLLRVHAWSNPVMSRRHCPTAVVPPFPDGPSPRARGMIEISFLVVAEHCVDIYSLQSDQLGISALFNVYYT